MSFNRAILKQPDESIYRCNVLDYLVAAVRQIRRIRKGGERIDILESLTPIHRSRGIPVASVEDHLAIGRHAGLAHVGGQLLCAGPSELRIRCYREIVDRGSRASA